MSILTGIHNLWSEEIKFSYKLEYGESCLNIGSEWPVIIWEVIFSYGYQQKVRILSEYTYGNSQFVKWRNKIFLQIGIWRIVFEYRQWMASDYMRSHFFLWLPTKSAYFKWVYLPELTIDGYLKYFKFKSFFVKFYIFSSLLNLKVSL